MNGKRACLMLDIGGTFIKSVVMNGTGTIYPGSHFTVPAQSEGSADDIARSLSAVVEHGLGFICDNGLKITAIGIASPGPFDYDNGVSLMTHKFRSIQGASLKEIVRSLPGIDKDLPVLFRHDVNSVLIGEIRSGNAQGFRNVAVATLGTGLGFAFSRDGVVQCNPAGSPARPHYNRPFNDGILEDYVSKRGFMRIYGEISGNIPEDMTVADIGELAAKGNADALHTFSTVGGILARGIKDTLCLEKIECLLLGGQISRSFEFMGPSLQEGLAGVPSLQKIAPVKNIGEAVFYGLLNYIEDIAI